MYKSYIYISAHGVKFPNHNWQWFDRQSTPSIGMVVASDLASRSCTLSLVGHCWLTKSIAKSDRTLGRSGHQLA